MNHSYEKTTVLATLGIAALSLALSIAITSTIAFGFVTGHASAPGARYAAVALTVAPVADTAARS
ncbi:MAG: hypothetical protein ABIT36_06435 [Steroidobacteraceae bacterium]